VTRGWGRRSTRNRRTIRRASVGSKHRIAHSEASRSFQPASSAPCRSDLRAGLVGEPELAAAVAAQLVLDLGQHLDSYQAADAAAIERE
jgi:hypothetical protein